MRQSLGLCARVWRVRDVAAGDPADIAIIKVTLAQRRVPVRWGDSWAVRVGDGVLPAGSPLGFEIRLRIGSFRPGDAIMGRRSRAIFRKPMDSSRSAIRAGRRAEAIGIDAAIASHSGGWPGPGWAIAGNFAGGLRRRFWRMGDDAGWMWRMCQVAQGLRRWKLAKAGRRRWEVVAGRNDAGFVPAWRDCFRATGAQGSAWDAEK